MEVEEQPLLIDDDEKLSRSMQTHCSRTKGSRLRSWALPMITHGLVALLVLLAVIFSPLASLTSFHELWKDKTKPSLHCMFEGGR